MRRVLFTTACAMLASSAAYGDVLYDASAYTNDYNANVDQEFADFPQYSTYMVDDVSFGAAVTIDSISTYFTNRGPAWATLIDARVNIFAKTGSLPGAGDDPTAGAGVTVTITDLGDGTWKMTATGLGINLAAGDYWIGMTPVAPFAVFGQEFHKYTGPGSLIGDQPGIRNPGGAFGFGPDWMTVNGALQGPTDANIAMLVEGTIVPAPGALALLGLAGLAGTRRRRA